VNPESKDGNPKDSPDSVRLMLAYLCIAAEKEASLETRVGILTRFGLSNIEIAKVCGSKVQSVKNARHSLRKYGSKSKKSK
jgi:DNA-binding CsgD family transcriptional regulator